MTKTASPDSRPEFNTPASVGEALRNVLALLGDREDSVTDFGMLMVACYGPLFRWDPVRRVYRFRARRDFPPGVRDTLRDAGEALTAEVVRILGGERGATAADVNAAITRLTH